MWRYALRHVNACRNELESARVRRRPGVAMTATFRSEEETRGRNRAGKLLLVEDEHLLRGLIAQFLRARDSRWSRPPTARRPSSSIASSVRSMSSCSTSICRFSAGSRSAAGSRSKNPSQPVMICSAAILDADVDVLRTLKVDHFLTKPYHPLDLLAGIDRVDSGRCPKPGQCGLIVRMARRRACIGRRTARFRRQFRARGSPIPWSSDRSWIKMLGRRVVLSGPFWSVLVRVAPSASTRCFCARRTVSWPENL